MINITFKSASIATTFLCGALALTLMFFPGVIFWLFDLQASPAAEVLGRRTAIIFSGIGVISFHARALLNAKAIKAISGGLAVMMAGLVALGIFEFIRGMVGVGIFSAVVTELAFASVYFRIFKAN